MVKVSFFGRGGGLGGCKQEECVFAHPTPHPRSMTLSISFTVRFTHPQPPKCNLVSFYHCLFYHPTLITTALTSCVGVWQYPISLICMGTHKASVARWHIGHQATSWQPTIWALLWSSIRVLALSMLLIWSTTSYQTTCTAFERSPIKGTCQCIYEQCSSFALWHLEPHGEGIHLYSHFFIGFKMNFKLTIWPICWSLFLLFWYQERIVKFQNKTEVSNRDHFHSICLNIKLSQV